jgi:nucleotide-binding universal stress UspA family protein
MRPKEEPMMFRNVVVGVDNRDGGRDAIALARVLLADGGKLTLAYIYQGDPHVWRGTSPPFEASESDRAHELLNKAAEEAGLEPQTRCEGSSSVGRGLHHLAETLEADLIVVGSSARGLFGRVLIGDDTRAALNGSPCAVAIAPNGYARQPQLMREIGVGYDESPESLHALGVARALAAVHEARLSALEAVEIPSYVLAVGPLLGDDVIDSVVDDARKEVAKLEGVEPHAVYGDPAEELTLFSASVDLLVLGSRSYGPMGRLVHGSTSQKLARSARCPLLVLTRGARTPAVRDEGGNGAVRASVTA